MATRLASVVVSVCWVITPITILYMFLGFVIELLIPWDPSFLGLVSGVVGLVANLYFLCRLIIFIPIAYREWKAARQISVEGHSGILNLCLAILLVTGSI